MWFTKWIPKSGALHINITSAAPMMTKHLVKHSTDVHTWLTGEARSMVVWVLITTQAVALG